MNSLHVKKKVKETIKATKDFFAAAKKSVQVEISKEAPKLVHTLDKSIDKAGRDLSSVLNSIDKKTTTEQLQLLKAYRSFLRKQTGFVDEQISARERSQSAGKPRE